MSNIQKLGRMSIDALYAGPRLEYVLNLTKNRRELWRVCAAGDKECILYDAVPARMFNESFIGPVQFAPAFLGITMDRAWATNGDPAPAAGNFVAANQIGGGMILTGLGAGIDDWIALHLGSNYPTTVAFSPHLHIRAEVADQTNVKILGGLVGASNLETGNGNPWTTPDDGLWIEYDTDVDTNIRFVTRSGGVQTATNLGSPPAGVASINIVVNDAGTEAKVIMGGSVVVRHTTNLPTVQLKPLTLCQTRAAAARGYSLYDFRLIFDAGAL